tara:strand:+ start:280 stop:834 length:555 start_codon:yes stop_codon:yes gene_type:complete
MKKLVLISILFLVFSISCGVDNSEIEKIDKITPLDTIFNYDSLTKIGFKKSKSYDVKNLPQADSAYFGWKEIDTEGPKDFEIRIYKTHKDAISYGTSFAEEGAGEKAIIRKGDANWKEGIKDRRIMVGGSTGASGKGGGAPTGSKSTNKYGDYIIYGNLIILCEGRTTEQAMERCSQFVIGLEK